MEYLANILTAGNTKAIKSALGKLLAMRSYMRAVTLTKGIDESQLREAGLDETSVQRMYRLLAIAKYQDRFIIPTSHQEKYVNVYKQQGSCGYCSQGSPSCSSGGDKHEGSR